jgi:hypothetical protein
MGPHPCPRLEEPHGTPPMPSRWRRPHGTPPMPTPGGGPMGPHPCPRLLTAVLPLHRRRDGGGPMGPHPCPRLLTAVLPLHRRYDTLVMEEAAQIMEARPIPHTHRHPHLHRTLTPSSEARPIPHTHPPPSATISPSHGSPSPSPIAVADLPARRRLPDLAGRDLRPDGAAEPRRCHQALAAAAHRPHRRPSSAAARRQERRLPKVTTPHRTPPPHPMGPHTHTPWDPTPTPHGTPPLTRAPPSKSHLHSTRARTLALTLTPTLSR